MTGSGTQLIAAEKTGRVCYAIDQEPRYIDIGVARWESFSGQKATREPRP
jgi:DNA modification methylase